MRHPARRLGTRAPQALGCRGAVNGVPSSAELSTCLFVEAVQLSQHGVHALGAPLVARVPHRLGSLLGAAAAQLGRSVHEQRFHVARDDRQHVSVEDGGAHQRRRYNAEHGRRDQEEKRGAGKRLEQRQCDERCGCAAAVARGICRHASQAAVRQHSSQAQERPWARREDLQCNARHEGRRAGHQAHHRQAARHGGRNARRQRRNAARRHGARSAAARFRRHERERPARRHHPTARRAPLPWRERTRFGFCAGWPPLPRPPSLKGAPRPPLAPAPTVARARFSGPRGALAPENPPARRSACCCAT